MKCIHSDGYDITEGEYYDVEDENSTSYQIVDDSGEVVWVPKHYLR